MSNFYNEKAVIILGGAGFVGRHLCKALAERGADVHIIDNLKRGGYAALNNIYTPATWHDVGIADRYIGHAVKEISPFAVFNLAAAVANVEYNQKNHNQMYLDNANLQTIPVMLCEQLNVPHFLQVSSACVYGEDANAPAVESNLGGEPVAANAGYSWAKRLGERAVQWSDLQHAVIVRPSNIYGPGDWYDDRAHVIPKLIKGYDEGTAKLFGDKSPGREFIYVEDVAEGMLHALEFGENKEAYNLGSDTRLGIVTVHQMIANRFNTVMVAPQIAEFDQGDDRRFSNRTKMDALGWSSNTQFGAGLKKTIEAYLETR